MDDLRKREIEQAKLLLEEASRRSQAYFDNMSPFEPLIIERLEMYGYARMRGSGTQTTADIGIHGIIGIQEFISKGKTHLEISQEEDKLAREQAIKNTEESLKLTRTSLKWTKIVAITSIVFSAFSLFYTIWQGNKKNVVEVKSLNEINTQQLVSQLEMTNQELKDIKTKFEELQKQTQNSPKN